MFFLKKEKICGKSEKKRNNLLKTGVRKLWPWISCLSLHIKFYWNTAMLIHLHMHDWQFGGWDRELMASKPKIFMVWQGKVQTPCSKIFLFLNLKKNLPKFSDLELLKLT